MTGPGRGYNRPMPQIPHGRQAGPLERTALEIRRLAAAAPSRAGGGWTRALLRESDALLGLVEECRLRRYPLLPAQVHSRVVRLTRRVDPDLRDQLGINRHPAHVAGVLFSAQERLLREAASDREPALAPIIPLFPGLAPETLPEPFAESSCEEEPGRCWR